VPSIKSKPVEQQAQEQPLGNNVVKPADQPSGNVATPTKKTDQV